MKNNNLVLGLNIGVQYISVVACLLTEDQGLKILAYSRGVSEDVHDTDALFKSIQAVIKRVLRQLDTYPSSVVVSISPNWMLSKKVYAEIEKGHSRYQFTLQDQQACIAKCREEIKGLVLHAIPLEFKLNGHNVLNPLGAFGQKLSVCTHLIYGKEDPLFSMVSAIQKSGFYLAGLICPSFASAQIYATNEELQSGIILVEMGTHVTSISIFQYGVLQRFITIPIGGARFTDDLAYCLKLSKFEAEELKCKEGSLLSSPDPLIKDILEARFNEWISFVQKTIQGLAMPVVIYGSPTQLPGFIDLFSSHIWQPVRSDVLPMFKSKLPYDGMNIALGALLYALKLGTLSYLPEKSIKKQIKDWISHLF